MGIDRKTFYAMATALLIGPAGCVVQPNQPPAVTPVTDNTAQPEPQPDANGCITWDPAGECTQWQPVAEGGGAPADECVDWDPSGECIQWADAGYYNAPADECIEWSPAGECINWQPYQPVDECIEWSPAGECINWMPANEQW